ncbi:penicillin-binding protein 1B [Maribrevibacterium harenarium]|uniref:penicillin-binding protein 1B n=1 Tax=Maribrevibacterium harenarium TaxID=2589817 RepID=UPI001F2839A7|nr:penicillin-binding protein 1B [Maribrevibacterium harenarium]
MLALLSSLPLGIWVWRLDKQVVATFEGQKWQIPSEVFSAPTMLESGQPWRQSDLVELLHHAGYRFGRNSEKVGWAAQSKTRVSAHLRSFSDHTGTSPAKRVIFSFENGQLAIQDLAGRPINRVWLDPISIGHLYGGNSEQRELLAYADIPPSFIDVLTLTEDRDFFSHHGISITGIARALWVNLTSGSRRQGGSTLTQQLVKNMFLSSERTYQRKLTEMLMALILEYRYDKQTILTAYVNEVYLTQVGRHGLHGFAAASQHFFGRPLAELSLDEMALLVGMVKGPSLYHPSRNPERALERRNVVLQILNENGRLRPQDYQRLVQQPIRLAAFSKQQPVFRDYLDMVAMQLGREFDEETLATQNLKIYTNLDVRTQLAATQALLETQQRLVQQHRELSELQGAVVITDRRTGAVRALVGSAAKLYTGFNRALGAVRPIGSLVKPPIYLAAIASGRYTWWSRLEDQPLRFDLGGSYWQPENYDRRYHGVVPMYEALAKSYNVATVALANELGFDRVAQTLKELGVKRPFTMVPAVALGAIELSPFEVARLYQPIASEGRSSELGIVRSVTDANGKVLTRFTPKSGARFSDAALSVTLAGMMKVPELGTAKAAATQFPHLQFAAKTGTTNNNRDSWFVAITDELSSVIWLGDDQNKALPITGSSGAQQVWIDFTRRRPQASLVPRLAGGAVWQNVRESEFVEAGERCDDGIRLPFVRGSEAGRADSCIWNF